MVLRGRVDMSSEEMVTACWCVKSVYASDDMQFVQEHSLHRLVPLAREFEPVTTIPPVCMIC